MHTAIAEERVPRLRGVSHAIAFVVALAAAVAIVALAPTGKALSASAVYATGLVALFGASALYHRWWGQPRFKPLLRKIDHSMIFVFIAASYTPLATILLHGTVGWLVLVGAWVGAAIGVAFSVGRIDASRAAVCASYLVLGWLALLALPQLLQVLNPAALALLASGAILYTVGAIVYAARRPNPWPSTFGFHEVFHALVIAAVASHYVAMVGWVLPAASA
jgi:hemolysin III